MAQTTRKYFFVIKKYTFLSRKKYIYVSCTNFSSLIWLCVKSGASNIVTCCTLLGLLDIVRDLIIDDNVKIVINMANSHLRTVYRALFNKHYDLRPM